MDTQLLAVDERDSIDEAESLRLRFLGETPSL
jgi:hypothetical protein